MKNTIVQTAQVAQPKYTKFRGKTLRETRYVVAPANQDRHADLTAKRDKVRRYRLQMDKLLKACPPDKTEKRTYYKHCRDYYYKQELIYGEAIKMLEREWTKLNNM